MARERLVPYRNTSLCKNLSQAESSAGFFAASYTLEAHSLLNHAPSQKPNVSAARAMNALRLRNPTTRLYCSYIFDWVFCLLLLVLFFLLDRIQPYHREFSVEDRTIMYEFIPKETIPVWALVLISAVFPVVVIVIVGLGVRRSPYDVHNGILGLLVAILLTTMFTQVIKYYPVLTAAECQVPFPPRDFSYLIQDSQGRVDESSSLENALGIRPNDDFVDETVSPTRVLDGEEVRNRGMRGVAGYDDDAREISNNDAYRRGIEDGADSSRDGAPLVRQQDVVLPLPSR
ncbi:unnamed protein product [Mortierella alpina]